MAEVIQFPVCGETPVTLRNRAISQTGTSACFDAVQIVESRRGEKMHEKGARQPLEIGAGDRT